jgi:hypothetical protein
VIRFEETTGAPAQPIDITAVNYKLRKSGSGASNAPAPIARKLRRLVGR